MRMIGLSFCLAAFASTGTAFAQDPPAAIAEAPIAAEARRFMDDYARELIAGDRERIIARYDRRGAYTVGSGLAGLESHASLAVYYRSPQWGALRNFAWRDLSFEPLGPDMAVVVGRFTFTRGEDPAPLTYSYSSLLVRQDGDLRIRMEHEAREP